MSSKLLNMVWCKAHDQSIETKTKLTLNHIQIAHISGKKALWHVYGLHGQAKLSTRPHVNNKIIVSENAWNA